MTLSELNKRIQELIKENPDDPEILLYDLEEGWFTECNTLNTERRTYYTNYGITEKHTKSGNFIVIDLS